jgi:formamidopyrimidine-DNA glycosylase
MPELPEVETVVIQLQRVVGKKIATLEIKDRKVIDSRIRNILPVTINGIYRKGKFIVFKLSKKQFLLVHLRMTGHFHYVKSEISGDYKKYLAGKFNLDDGSFFTYNTIRRFGTVRLMDAKEVNEYFAKQGVEPLEISSRHFINLIKKYPGANIKNKLLDQKMVMGIGNIYAQEALYHAKVHPKRKIAEVSDASLGLLHREMQRILRLAIKNNGTTVDNYSHLDGKGDFQNLLAVYQQKKCPREHEIQRIVIGGRGTNYCSKCQS